MKVLVVFLCVLVSQILAAPIEEDVSAIGPIIDENDLALSENVIRAKKSTDVSILVIVNLCFHKAYSPNLI